MLTRRQFLSLSALAGASWLIPQTVTKAHTVIRPASTEALLDPTTVPKYGQPLIIPPAMPRSSEIVLPGGQPADYYRIAMRQFTQHILPPSMGLSPTTVWSYGSADHADTFNYPAFTIESQAERPVRVQWINDLVDAQGHYLPHLLPVDPTLHWANPPGPRDGHGHFMETPPPYTGPVPAVTHVHGAHTTEESDGYAEAWYLPAATDIPGGYFSQGSLYDEFRVKFAAQWGVDWTPGTATFQYPNDQRAATLWYHDHTLGMTRLNVYAGPAGFYIVRGGSQDLPVGVLPGPAPSLGDPPGLSYYEIPIAIQDRWFNTDGSLFYPDSRAFFDGFGGPYIPYSDIAPYWNPEIFPNMMVVNGRTWPYLQVEPRRYRLRLLNGSNSRFVILKMVTGDPTIRPGVAALPFWQIGAEGGFLPAPVMLEQLLMSPAERADVIVDLSGLAEGTEIYLINEGPDEPFGGGVPGADFPFADPATTGQVMKLVVGQLSGPDPSTPPDQLTLPVRTALGSADRVRQVSLNEEDSLILPGVGPRAAELGTVDAQGLGVIKGWDEPITEIVRQGETEVWEIHNFTMDAHPIHLHQVMFEVIDRESRISGVVRPPEPWETGVKDTVTAYPDEITRVKARFDLPGLYVWHCHIVEHEDNEMMRPNRVVQRAYLPLITKG